MHHAASGWLSTLAQITADPKSAKPKKATISASGF